MVTTSPGQDTALIAATIATKQAAPLASQESLEEAGRAGSQLLLNGEGGHEAEAAEAELEEVYRELQTVVVVRETGAGAAPAVPAQLTAASPRARVAGAEQSPVAGAGAVIVTSAQVLPRPQLPGAGRDTAAGAGAGAEEALLEKLLESDGPDSRGDSSRCKSQAEETEDNDDVDDKKVRYSTAKNLSQDLIVTVENSPDEDLVVTERLPEVLLVAEQLPERLKTGRNILAHAQSREKEPSAPPYESSDLTDLTDGGSTLTLGRADTAAEDSSLAAPSTAQLTAASTAAPRHKRVRHEVALREADTSCISPFFVGVYSSLGVLIIIMIGLNFWFGFHLLFFIGLLAVIALFACILTEFNDFHNEPD